MEKRNLLGQTGMGKGCSRGVFMGLNTSGISNVIKQGFSKLSSRNMGVQGGQGQGGGQGRGMNQGQGQGRGLGQGQCQGRGGCKNQGQRRFSGKGQGNIF